MNSMNEVELQNCDRNFQESWRKDPEIDKWINSSTDFPTVAYCTACKMTLKSSSVKVHVVSKRHTRNALNITRLLSGNDSFELSPKEKSLRAEIKLTSRYACI